MINDKIKSLCTKFVMRVGLPKLYQDRVRRNLPEKECITLNGVEIPTVKVRRWDKWMPSILLPSHVAAASPDWRIEGYEEALCKSLKSYAKAGDHVVIVGGGLGVTTCIASKLVGKSGQVQVFEGSSEMVAHTSATVSMNTVYDNVNIFHRIVGENVSLEKETSKINTEKIMGADEIQRCDILELDCEGAEINILKNLKIRPRVIIVETHGMLDSPTEKVKNILTKMKYSIVSQCVAEKRAENYCLNNDVKVLVGVNKNNI